MLQHPTVSVVMITYNHEKYIQQAIEGVLMQVCNFDIELIISNDCSTDNTDYEINKIIKGYNGKIKIKYFNHEINKGMIDNFIWSLKKGAGKYIALCEGDDYWTEPLKLQKQVVFLEANEDYGLVATRTKDYYEKTKKFSKTNHTNKRINTFIFDDFIIKNRIQTVSVLIRTNIIINYLNYLKKHNELLAIDFSIWLFTASVSKIAKIEEVTAVYRIRNGSVSQSNNRKELWRFQKKVLKILNHYINSDESLNKITINRAYYNKAKLYYRNAAFSKDLDICSEFLLIFKNNNDYIRYLLLTLILKNSSTIKISNIYERIINKLQRTLT